MTETSAWRAAECPGVECDFFHRNHVHTVKVEEATSERAIARVAVECSDGACHAANGEHHHVYVLDCVVPGCNVVLRHSHEGADVILHEMPPDLADALARMARR